MKKPHRSLTAAARSGFLWILLLLCMISACSSRFGNPNPGPGERARDGLAVLGVTAKSGLKSSLNPALVASELAARLAERGDILLVPEPQVRRIVGAKPLDGMLATYSRDGRFNPFQMQNLMAADLRTRRGIVIRLESDKTEKLPVFRQAVYNEAGNRVVDRERRVYITRRTTAMSATVLDLATGRTIWTRLYRISPEAKSLSRQYLGSSFTGSVAAEVANTVVNGFGGGNHPPPPSFQGSLRALIREIAFKAPAP